MEEKDKKCKTCGAKVYTCFHCKKKVNADEVQGIYDSEEDDIVYLCKDCYRKQEIEKRIHNLEEKIFQMNKVPTYTGPSAVEIETRKIAEDAEKESVFALFVIVILIIAFVIHIIL